MKVLPIIIIILFSGCKFETKKEKQVQEEKRLCDLAYLYISECAYEYRKVTVAPFEACTENYARRMLGYPCDVLVESLKQ
jgi:hypothetical protein